MLDALTSLQRHSLASDSSESSFRFSASPLPGAPASRESTGRAGLSIHASVDGITSTTPSRHAGVAADVGSPSPSPLTSPTLVASASAVANDPASRIHCLSTVSGMSTTTGTDAGARRDTDVTPVGPASETTASQGSTGTGSAVVTLSPSWPPSAILNAGPIPSTASYYDVLSMLDALAKASVERTLIDAIADVVGHLAVCTLDVWKSFRVPAIKAMRARQELRPTSDEDLETIQSVSRMPPRCVRVRATVGSNQDFGCSSLCTMHSIPPGKTNRRGSRRT